MTTSPPYLHSHPSKANSLDNIPLKRTLKNCGKDELKLFTVENFWLQLEVRKDSVFFKGLATRSLVMLQ